MFQKLKNLATNEGSLYFLSSLIYSFSTYIIALLIPYKLNLEMMAEFSALFNIVILISYIFEFGIVTSFLRHNQIYQSSKYINAFLQLFMFVMILLLAYTSLGGVVSALFGLGNIDVKQEYIYFSVLSVLMWVFLKSNYLAHKNIRAIIINAFIILTLRAGFLMYILLNDETMTLNHIYITLFVLPFLWTLLIILKENIIKMVVVFKKIKQDKRYLTLYMKHFKQFILFSVATYFISLLYVYASRYPIVYVTAQNDTVLMAELGYAFSFFGLILVFITSIRTYLISKFNISDMDAIMIYLEKMRRIWPQFLLGSIVVSVLGSYLVYLIKPSYLSDRAVIFLFMLILTYMMIAYFSLITLLSKTFNFNNMEIKLNIIRLILVLLSVYLVFSRFTIVGFALINLSMVGVEYYFSKKVVQKIMLRKKEGIL